MFTGCTACLPGVLLCTGLGVNVYRVYCMFTGCTAMYRTRSRYLPGVLHVYRVYCYVQDSESMAKDEVQKVLQLTEEKRRAWEKAWEDQRKRLEQNFQVCQFRFDLKQVCNSNVSIIQ